MGGGCPAIKRIKRARLEIILGHELVHAYIWATEGPGGFVQNQTGAVKIENEIARQINPNAPLRHPTQGHGTTWRP